MTDSARRFEDQIASYLEEAGYTFKRNPSVGGLRPDFLIKGPHGERVVVEAKTWSPRGGNTARALNQAEHYRQVTKADRAFVVLDQLQRNHREAGVVNVDGLLEVLGDYFAKHKPSRRRKAPARQSLGGTVFAAMPFDSKYDDTYFVAMTHAAESIDATCERVDRTEYVGDIVEQIKAMIEDSIVVIVDLSESKPNVLYEAGYADALPRPTVYICSTPLGDLPFDVRNKNVLTYALGGTAKLRQSLTRRLKGIVP